VKSKFVPLAIASLFIFAVLIFSPAPTFAQEGELKVVDEVIAQVNDDVITLSSLRRESKERVEALKQGGMTEQQATEEVNKRQAELIATLINEQLLMQRGKELDLSSEVESEVNKRMLEVAKDQGITSIEKLDAAMKENGLDPAATRQTMRVEMMKQAVIQQEVDRKIFFGLTIDELIPVGGPGRSCVVFAETFCLAWKRKEEQLPPIQKWLSKFARMLFKLPVHYLLPLTLPRLDRWIGSELICSSYLVSATKR